MVGNKCSQHFGIFPPIAMKTYPGLDVPPPHLRRSRGCGEGAVDPEHCNFLKFQIVSSVKRQIFQQIHCATKGTCTVLEMMSELEASDRWSAAFKLLVQCDRDPWGKRSRSNSFRWKLPQQHDAFGPYVSMHPSVLFCPFSPKKVCPATTASASECGWSRRAEDPGILRSHQLREYGLLRAGTSQMVRRPSFVPEADGLNPWQSAPYQEVMLDIGSQGRWSEVVHLQDVLALDAGGCKPKVLLPPWACQGPEASRFVLATSRVRSRFEVP
ncbi:uncharacterized protein LOC125323244 [Corvus hawaiiensis]|uniref:uncharacterized protein LOC125323244 n=2 Tax=Corvus hawaiiensis TaxID=134902 RepID=UPI0020194998|nr:uncharacterized protein LOC125323244 [Corvus hawaiiensis]XP_048154030.1 uncharacterized protein LOC125323244 [Corvus hawaiiensis]XP_048154031.1 uncharacterized protein LOC125323244 [Corvus hawaiiensis]XP_048154032.1 uncharacterized protein LOC125323244 [Corvus hawaiiensis]XP_048154033.1 uncharacterized protein LOC125323244 [Corvus hawaiiensis]XP_048154035.1 uncharacterized protein LOC125323244 [Corvus hawaiiensis]XP_048154036.1 uncharacterized protein LOC125323244 [Corvus hawaiiensis]XP_0